LKKYVDFCDQIRDCAIIKCCAEAGRDGEKKMAEQKGKRMIPLVNTQEEYYIRPRAADKKMKTARRWLRQCIYLGYPVAARHLLFETIWGKEIIATIVQNN
jgi:hypothetical protein